MRSTWLLLGLALATGAAASADLAASAHRTPRATAGLARLGPRTDAAARQLIRHWSGSAPARLLADRCTAAGLTVPSAAAVAGATALLMGGATAVTLATSLPVTLGLVVAGVVLGRTVLGRRIARRQEDLVAQLPELARLLSNAASAGLALRSSLHLAAREVAEPARSELTRVVEALTVGDPLDRALADLARRLPSREISVLVTTLVVQQQAGGHTISALRALAGALEERKELRREVHTVMAGAVSSTHVVLAMGPGAVALMELATPGVIGALIGTVPGRAAVAASLALDLLGLTIIRRLTRIDL